MYRRAPTLVPFPSGRPFLYQPRPIPAETAKPRSSMLEKLKAPTCSTVAWLPRHRSHETAAKYRPSSLRNIRYSDSNDSRREREREGGSNNRTGFFSEERCRISPYDTIREERLWEELNKERRYWAKVKTRDLN